MRLSKKHFIFCLFLLLSYFQLSAQSHDSGTISFQIGYDGAVHGTEYASKYQNALIDTDTSVAATSMLHLSTQYSFSEWISMGARFNYGTYIEHPKNAETNGNTISIIAADLRLYPISSERWGLYLGVDYGLAFMEINRIYTVFVPMEASYGFKGPHWGLQLGYDWYFGDFIGLYMNLGFSSNNLQMNRYEVDGADQDIDGFSNTLRTKGFHGGIGVAARLR